MIDDGLDSSRAGCPQPARRSWRTGRVGAALPYSRMLAPWLAMAAVLLIPPQPGLPAEGQRVLAIVAAAVVLWATEVVPVAVSSLLVVVLLMVLGVVKAPSEALVGFSSPILYFLVGSQTMGAALMRSGLAERLAAFLVERSRGNSKRLTVQLLLALPFMAFVMPSAINRNAMLIPAYEHAFRSLGVGRGDPLARVVMLILGLLNPFASSAFMTGGMAPMTTSTLLGGFTWFRWFALMGLPYYALLALGGAMIYLLHRPADPGQTGRKGDGETGKPGDAGTRGRGDAGTRRDPLSLWERVRAGALSTQHRAGETPAVPALRTQNPEPRTQNPAPLTRDEKMTLLVVAGASLLWLTDFVHHWNSAVPALLAAVLLMAPGMGVLTWNQFEKTVGWSNFFVVGASLSLAQVLISTGAASWFAQTLLGLFSGNAVSPALVALFVILVTTVVHLGIPNMSACIALLIPVVAAFAGTMHVSPTAAGLIVGIVVDTVVLYPVQTATNLLAYETGHFDSGDVLKIGLGMLAVTIGVVLLVAIPWWNLMGLPFAQ